MQVHLKLRNWRSVAKADIDLGRFTVIVGRNSSGKSNVVDALVFASEVAFDASTAVSRRGGIESVRRYATSKPFDVAVEVRATMGERWWRHELVLKSGRDGAWSFGSEEVEIHGDRDHLLIRRDKDGAVDGFPTDVGHFASRLDPSTSLTLVTRQILPPLGKGRPFGPPLAVRTLHPVPELMRRPQVPSDQPRLMETGENVTTAFQKLSDSSREIVLGAMRRIIPGLLDISVQAAGRYLTLAFTQEHRKGRRPTFAASEMSDGALRALAVLVAAQQIRRNELLIIEEPEVNLHPGAADVIYDALHAASDKGAVLLTTHSPELLDRAQNDEILVCDYLDGVTSIGPVDTGQREVLKEGLFTAAELMRTEGLRREGAAPDLVDERA
ncbi:AAA family ATPase [Myxococcota bacterium]|nr:AAA family ATPase [Myxococcota bacterium]